MVADEHAGARRQMLQSAHVQRHGRQPQQQGQLADTVTNSAAVSHVVAPKAHDASSARSSSAAGTYFSRKHSSSPKLQQFRSTYGRLIG